MNAEIAEPLTRTSPRTHYLAGLSPHGFHRVAYYEWGDAANPRVVVCVHGLTRNGRDFDVLAEALATTHRVLAIDIPGRGLSDWLLDPNDYIFPVYLTALAALIARSGVETVDWVGTSMGGLLGIVLAAQPNTPITRLVVNDVGPTIEVVALNRIGSYLGMNPGFATFAEGLAYVRAISAPFGALTDAQWGHLTRTSIHQRPDGRWGFRYDPDIAVPFRTASTPTDLWPLWDAIRCPTLLLHGEVSDLLSVATAKAMSERGPKAQLIDFAGIGHAPALLSDEQIAPILTFLRAEI